jgi:ferredoxin
MMLRILDDRCQGHARCLTLIPDLVEVDDLGYARAADAVVVPDEQHAAARLAARNCPEHAIDILEDET